MLVSQAKWFKNSHRPAECRRIRPQIEALEHRQLMSTTPLPKISGGWGISASLDGNGLGTANPTPDRDVYTFQGHAGDVFRLSLQNQGGSFFHGDGVQPPSKARVISDNVLRTDSWGPNYTVTTSGLVTIEVFDNSYELTGSLATGNDPFAPGHVAYDLGVYYQADIAVTGVQVINKGQAVRFDYSAWGRLGGDEGNKFTARVYESADDVFDSSDTPLTANRVFSRDLTTGELQLDKAPTLPNIFVVASPRTEDTPAEITIRDENDGNNSARCSLPDAVALVKTTPKGQRVPSVGISGASFEVAYFQSRDMQFDAGDLKFRVGPPAVNQVPRVATIPFNPERPFTLLVVDPYGKVFEYDESNNSALFSTVFTATYNSRNGELRVYGDDGNNKIFVSQAGDRISLGGAPIYYIREGTFATSVPARQFPREIAPVRKIHIDGRGGNDVIRLDRGKQPIRATTFISGGLGDDWIYGSLMGPNVIYGGAGDDKIFGGRLADQLYGGSGSDRLYAYEGNDRIWGDAVGPIGFTLDGDDVLSGGIGNDQLRGGGGDDKLFGQDGADELWGDSGSDWLEAGSEHEFADFGDAGSDDFNAHKWVVDGASMADIKQSNVTGNCLFLSALASVANTRSYAWTTTRELRDGIRYLGNYQYGVQLFDGAKWTEQTVTFQGAVDPFDSKLDGKGEFWTVLYQRAYLQMHPGVAPDGTLIGALQDQISSLTGSTSSNRSVDDGVFLDIDDAISHQRNVICGTGWSLFGNPYLKDSHAYTVVKVWADPATGMRFVQIRNPWGEDGPAPADADPSDGLIELSWEQFVAATDKVIIQDP